MIYIGVVIHGPAVIDSGNARQVLELLAGIGDIQAILGGTMGRSAVIDAGLEDIIDISRNLRPSESIREMSLNNDLIVLVNEGKSFESGLIFGSRIAGKLGEMETPLYQIEYGGECSIIPWVGASYLVCDELQSRVKARIIKPLQFGSSIEKVDQKVLRKVGGVRPGEYVTVNGIVIGKAISDDVCIISESGTITAFRGIGPKWHGIEKLQGIDLSQAIVRSGPLRTANITPRVLDRAPSGYAVIIDHAAEETFEIANGADVAVVVGDDTTAIAGDLLSRLGIPMIGITDGDRDGLLLHTHVPPGSVIIRVRTGNDDVVGRRVQDGIFFGRNGKMMSGSGFEDLLQKVIQEAGMLVEEVLRY